MWLWERVSGLPFTDAVGLDVLIRALTMPIVC